jgi:hypothetical protein
VTTLVAQISVQIQGYGLSFTPDELAEGTFDFFLIDTSTLCQFLDEAEQEEGETKQERGVIQHLLPGAKKQRLEETPSEEVISDGDHKVTDGGCRVEHESQKIIALKNLHSGSWAQNKTVIYS